jgi:glycerol uptake facilitator-like aquaporin
MPTDSVKGPRLLAEAVGTFMLVMIGPGAAAVNVHSHGAVTHVGVSLSFAFVILAAVYALGHISGAHFNPAVTFGFWLSRRFPGRDVVPYVLAQLTGATAGAILLRLLLGADAEAAATVPHVRLASALIIEMMLTFFLMLVVMAVATDHRVASPGRRTSRGTDGRVRRDDGRPPHRRQHEPRENIRSCPCHRRVDRPLALLARAPARRRPRGPDLRLPAEGRGS